MARKVEARPARKSTKARGTKPRVAAPKRKPAAKPRVRKSAAAAEAPLPAASHAEDLALLETLNRRYYDAFSSLDPDEVGRLWWHDEQASCIHPGWDIRHGWPFVRESYVDIFSNTKSIRFALGDVRTRVVGDLAYVTCVENLVSEEGDSGDYLGAVLATNVFERRRGEWRIIHHHASPFSSDEADLPEGPLH